MKLSLENNEKQFLDGFTVLMVVMFFLFVIGIINQTPTFLLEINFCLKIIIASYLIYRFNTFRKQKIEFTELDRHLVFSSSVYIILLSFADIFLAYLSEIRTFVSPFTKPMVDSILKSPG